MVSMLVGRIAECGLHLFISGREPPRPRREGRGWARLSRQVGLPSAGFASQPADVQTIVSYLADGTCRVVIESLNPAHSIALGFNVGCCNQPKKSVLHMRAFATRWAQHKKKKTHHDTVEQCNITVRRRHAHITTKPLCPNNH